VQPNLPPLALKSRGDAISSSVKELVETTAAEIKIVDGVASSLKSAAETVTVESPTYFKILYLFIDRVFRCYPTQATCVAGAVLFVFAFRALPFITSNYSASVPNCPQLLNELPDLIATNPILIIALQGPGRFPYRFHNLFPDHEITLIMIQNVLYHPTEVLFLLPKFNDYTCNLLCSGYTPSLVES